MNSRMSRIVEGLAISRVQERVEESVNEEAKRPLELKDVIDDLEKIAIKKYKAPKDKWAVEQRKKYTTKLYRGCMKALTPTSADKSGSFKKSAMSIISSDLRSFYANEVKVDTNCPKEWRQEAQNSIVDSINDDIKSWIDSRYQFTEKDGKTYVSSKW